MYLLPKFRLIYLIFLKVMMHGKVIAVAHTSVHIKTSSLWAEFVIKNR